MAGIHRSSTLRDQPDRRELWLGMAGIHRSSTLDDRCSPDGHGLGMAGIHRSSTLFGNIFAVLNKARDGRDSPLKYTPVLLRLLRL